MTSVALPLPRTAAPRIEIMPRPVPGRHTGPLLFKYEAPLLAGVLVTHPQHQLGARRAVMNPVPLVGEKYACLNLAP
jgi:hypothetical protein